MLWVSELPTCTVDGTEERDSVEDALGLEGVDPRQSKMSVIVLEMGLCKPFWMSGKMGGRSRWLCFPMSQGRGRL